MGMFKGDSIHNSGLRDEMISLDKVVKDWSGLDGNSTRGYEVG